MAYTHATKRGTVTQYTSKFYVEGRVIIVSQDAKNNTTTFKAQMWHGTSKTSQTWKGLLMDSYIRMDQAYTYFDDRTQNNNPWKDNPCLFFEKQYTVKHDSVGKKTIDLWMYTYAPSGSYGPGYCYVIDKSNAWKVALPQIDRTAPFVELHQLDITHNTYTIKATPNVACDQLQYQLNGGAWINMPQGEFITITGLTPNTNYNFRARARKTSNAVYGYMDIDFTTYPAPVELNVFAVTVLSATEIAVTVETNDSTNTEKIVLQCNELTKTITGSSGTHTFTVTPETKYTVTATAYTKGSGATTSRTQTVTTPADSFCTVIKPDGTVLPKKKMFMIDTNGIVTEVKKGNVSVLS